MTDNEYPGRVEIDEDLKVPSAPAPETVIPLVTGLYQLVFKGNRAFEFQYQKDTLRFESGKLVSPAKYLPGIPAEIINSKSFQLQQSKFLVKKIG
jgi:hypothetical protein